MPQPPKILIATHAVFVDGNAVHGPAHILYDYLIAKKIPVRLIEFPLSSGVIDWPRQVKHVLAEIKSYQPDIYIGIDPLNGWAGRIAKRRGLVETFVYHTPDYSPRRFGFAPLNWLYHWIDRTVLAAADHCWTVSARITDVRKKQGRDDALTIFNGIPFVQSRVPNYRSDKRFRLIMVGNLNQTMDIEMLLGVIGELKGEFPRVHLDIVGDGAGRQELELRSKQLTLESNVTFHGNQPLDKVIALLQKAGVGIALYSGSQGFNYFGDSKKIREYSAVGLPVLTTPVVVNAEEIIDHNAGIVVPPEARDITQSLRRLLESAALYKRQRGAAITLAKKTDLSNVLKAAFRSIDVV